MKIEELEFNYIRMTWGWDRFVSNTWRNHIKIDRLIKMICYYCVRARSNPSYLTPDETYGVIIEMSQTHLWSLTSSELLITLSSNEKTCFGKPFSKEIALEIKKRAMEYWEKSNSH